MVQRHLRSPPINKDNPTKTKADALTNNVHYDVLI